MSEVRSGGSSQAGVCLLFKQKTAYGMRISDCSSDVCSSDLKAAVRLAVAARFLHQPHRHADIAHAVGSLDDLDKDASGRGHRLVHVPQRAGAAIAGELEARRGMTLGDVARHVDAKKEEGDAPRPRPLERGEAVADLLEAHAE